MESLEARQLLAGDVLVSAIDAPSNSDANHSTVSLIDLRDSEASPIRAASLLELGASQQDEGTTGLAILVDGTTVASVAMQSNLSSSGSSPLASPSQLVIRSTVAGEVLRRVSVNLDGSPLAIADLTNDISGIGVLAITPSAIGTTDTARLVRVDPVTGNATLIGDTGLSGNVSIALHPDGTLYATSQDNGFSSLQVHRINPDDASVVDSKPITDSTPYGFTTGLAVHPESGLLYGSESHLGRFFTIDLESLTRTFLETQSPLRGVSGDLAFATRHDSDDVQQLLHADFEPDSDGFTIDNSGGEVLGLWHHSVGRRDDGQLNHSRTGSFYYGLFETATGGGNTILDRHHRGVISSPEVTLPSDGTSILSFSYLLDTRPELDRDFVTVSIDDGTIVAPILSRAEGTLPETAGDWLTATYNLSAYAGQTISVDFEYDSGDPVRVDPEGWYVDDVIIVHLGDGEPLTADVSVNKVIDDATPNEGQTVTYTVTASNSNQSEGTATGVTVIDTLPDGVTFDSFTTSAGLFDPITGTWDGFDLIRGESEQLFLTVIVNAGTSGDVLTNAVTIDSDLEDPNPDDNTATQTSAVNRVDLSADKSVADETPSVGDQVTFSIAIVNDSDSNAVATGVTVIDVLPEGLTFVSASDSGVYDLGDRTIRWNLSDLAIGGEVVLNVVASVDTSTASQSLVNLARVNANETDPDPSNNESTRTIVPDAIATQTVQFITPLSVFRSGPLTAGDTIVEPIVPDAGSGAITGFAWADIDADGVRDADEQPRVGFQIFLDLAANGLAADGVFDPEREPSVVTDINGRYLFNDLAPGEYIVREADFVRGTEFLTTYPVEAQHTVAVLADQVVAGDAFASEPPNFGGLEVSPYVRPADQFTRFIDDADFPLLRRALIPWQSVAVTNTTGAAFTINEIDLSGVNDLGRGLIELRQIGADGGLPVVSSDVSILVEPGTTATFLLLYDPAIRVADQVQTQYPDWLGAEGQTRDGVHTFAPGEQLAFVTDTGLRFNVELVGGSTFDSDISHDGAVDVEDIALLDNLLIAESVIRKGDSGLFDPTADINARCPNGADQVTGTCTFPVGPTPQREIAMGDFGPLNVEIDPPSSRTLIPLAVDRVFSNLS